MQAEAGFAVLGAFFICALPVGALQSTMTEEEYGAAMTEINFIVGDAELHIDARYWPELFEDL